MKLNIIVLLGFFCMLLGCKELPSEITTYPVVSFTVTPDTIHTGDPVTITWGSEYVVSCNLNSEEIALNGVMEGRPQKTSVYTLTAISEDGTIVTKKDTVTVLPWPPGPWEGYIVTETIPYKDPRFRNVIISVSSTDSSFFGIMRQSFPGVFVIRVPDTSKVYVVTCNMPVSTCLKDEIYFYYYFQEAESIIHTNSFTISSKDYKNTYPFYFSDLVTEAYPRVFILRIKEE